MPKTHIKLNYSIVNRQDNIISNFTFSMQKMIDSKISTDRNFLSKCLLYTILGFIYIFDYLQFRFGDF